MSGRLQDFAKFSFRPESQEAFEVAVVYEDTPARERAVALCQHLIQDFDEEIDFDFTWWKFRYLQDPQISRAAFRSASIADLLIFASTSGREPPASVKEWIDRWLSNKQDQECALLSLVGDAGEADLERLPAFSYARNVAWRGHMDFLPNARPSCQPGSLRAIDRIRERADQGSHILEGILHHTGHSAPPPPPSHWGINE